MTLSLSNHLAADSAAQALRRDVYDGLTQTPKSLPPKWFYDSVGSDLFDQITRLPEYYPTRAEAEILRDRSVEIAAASGADTLVELGSGTSEKTRLLLSALRDEGSLRRFIPFDVDAGMLQAASSAILGEYPGIEIDAVCGDFEEHLGKIPRVGRRLVVFLGSTIGNLTAAPRAEFLSALSDTLRPGDTLLLGTDLVKDTDRLVRAYDDSAGVTARFNRNVLAVVNRELDADFDLDAFEHVARWNADEERIEMWLQATSAQRVRVAALDLTVDFASGEEMLTEVSCKFRPDGVAAELARCRSATHALVDRQGGRLRTVAVDEMTALAQRWRAARPKVAGLHLDSGACSRQSFAVIDAAAAHARHEAEVGGYVGRGGRLARARCGPLRGCRADRDDAGRRRLHHRREQLARPAVEQLDGGTHRRLSARRVRPEPRGDGGERLRCACPSGGRNRTPGRRRGRRGAGRRSAGRRASDPAGQPPRHRPARSRARRGVPRPRSAVVDRRRAGFRAHRLRVGRRRRLLVVAQVGRGPARRRDARRPAGAGRATSAAAATAGVEPAIHGDGTPGARRGQPCCARRAFGRTGGVPRDGSGEHPRRGSPSWGG